MPACLAPARACRWLSHPSAAEFDLAAIFIGQDPNFTCPQCSHVFRMPGIKWQLLRELSWSPAWDAIARQYK